jgi:hypothetical protein
MGTALVAKPRWYTSNLKRRWKPETLEDFNERFQQQLAIVRTAYHLAPRRFGVDISPNYLRPIIVRDNAAFATIKQLEWARFVDHKGERKLTFYLDISLSVANKSTSPEKEQAEYAEVRSAPVWIRFPPEYPNWHPDYGYDFQAQELPRHTLRSELNWVYSTFICTFNDSQSWINDEYSMLRAIDVMFDWLGATYFGKNGKGRH